MSHMNSLQIRATAIFTALLFIIMVSASRFTYTLTPATERESSVSCRPPEVRDAPVSRVCPWPRLRRAQHWVPRSTTDFATTDFAAPDMLLAEPFTDARALQPWNDENPGR